MASIFRNQLLRSCTKVRHPQGFEVLGLRWQISSKPTVIRQSCRNLSIHEYQSQGILRDADVLVPQGKLAYSPMEAGAAAEELGGTCVLKSQVLAGGRGKGSFDSGLEGGIHVVKSAKEAKDISRQMLGYRLHTKQTKEAGLIVDKLYVAEVVDYSSEYYLSMTIDRQTCGPAIIASKAGGTSIEETANKDPTAITRVHFDYAAGIDDHVVQQTADGLGVRDPQLRVKLKALLEKLWGVFKTKDATLVEINPLVLATKPNDFLCLDAKFNFDNAAKPRQKELFALEEASAREGAELEAEKSGLVYVKLDGNIGNVVNGAGLAMATNDAIEHYGGKSANFLDAGGQATKETMVDAFRIVLDDERVKVVLVNIYGGIIRCDMIADSIIAAAKELGPLRTPLVVRLQGTNSKEGQKKIAESDLAGVDLHAVDGFGGAAKLAVELANK